MADRGESPPSDPPAAAAADLDPEEVARRAGSFGTVARHYARYRPGPPTSAVDWFLPHRVERVVDLGAGAGALTRLVVDRADEVVAVEPDERMRAVLAGAVPAARALAGTGESIPLPAGAAQAVLASSSWHWMDPLATLREVGRVLVPGGVLGVVWSGPDREAPFMGQASAVLAERTGRRAGTGDRYHGGGSAGGSDGVEDLPGLIMGDVGRRAPRLDIPEGMPFTEPENRTFRWEAPLTADDLVGLLGTFSWIITLEPATRQRVLAEARRLLADLLGVAGDRTVDVGFRADAWRARSVA